MLEDVFVEIDTNILENNINNITNKYRGYEYYIGVVKGNCYGHGSLIVNTIEKTKINYLAVSTLVEAIEIRKYTQLPILCMQPIDINNLDIASRNNITITISSYDYYQQINKSKLRLNVHLKLDTGMNRLGIKNKYEVKSIYEDLINNQYLNLEGIYTHIQTTGIIDKKWDLQINEFNNLTQLIDINKIKIVHIYSTNSLVIHPKLPFCNGVRFGILMYGIAPKKLNYSGIKGIIRKYKHNYIRKKYKISSILDDYDINVYPSLKLVSRIVELKKVNKGENIGYGLGYKVKSNSIIAVVPIGYGDGLCLTHTLSYVYINNKKYQVIGSINMKMITILVDDCVKINDRVEIINNNIRELCQHNHITPHYLFTTIPSNIKRIYK